MILLHYSLGFPPYRTGGMTKYCIDLMIMQKENHNEVGLLWPGRMYPHGHQKILQHKGYQGIASYEICNPLLVSLDEGILNPEDYMKKGDERVYEEFLQKLNPDVIHIHTLMGLHQEFLDVAKKLQIKTVYTTHDYFGICPKVSLFRNGGNCTDDHNCEDCVLCNAGGLSSGKIYLMQSSLYRKMKDSFVMRKIRERHRNKFFEESEETKPSETKAERNAIQYRKLRVFYIKMIESMDHVHFNSTLTESVYLNFVTPQKSTVIPVFHCDIKDCRKVKSFTKDELRLTYLGPAKPFKGYNFLKEELDTLWNQGQKRFSLSIYSSVADQSPYMIVHNRYNYSELETIFDKTDLLVVPSVWNETFGFTVLEAFSYGVPVLITPNVGAKDIVGEGGFITTDIKNQVKELINNREPLKKCNKHICDREFITAKQYESIIERSLYEKT